MPASVPSKAHDSPEQTPVRCVLMRGGTSKALFFHEADVPAPGPARDAFLKRAMGTPDLLQIDGMGGSRLVTSKVAIIKRSERDDVDVDYTFAQIDVDRDGIDNTATCGNISSAVGPFAIDEGLVSPVEPVTSVRVLNTNTDKVFITQVPVRGGKARVLGECAIPGVPGSGAPILMDYAETVGAKTGRLMPTGNVVDTIKLKSGKSIQVSIVDVANPCVFFNAAELGLSGSELPLRITNDKALIEIVGEIQSKAGEMIGLWPDWKAVHLPALPLAVSVAPPADYVDANGDMQRASKMDLRARLVFLGRCHESMAGSGSMCLAAATRVPGSIANQAVGEQRASNDSLQIGHPLGVMEVKVSAKKAKSPLDITFSTLGFARTARRLMAGTIYVPSDLAQEAIHG